MLLTESEFLFNLLFPRTDLALRSPGKTIDKLTFLKVFNLPGILGERLFAAFDRKQNDVIDLEEFVGGLGLIVRGSIEDKIDVLFTMYDMQGDGVVSKSELTTMLNSVVFSAYTIVEASSDHESSTSVTERLSPDITQSLKDKVSELVQSAFADKAVANGDRLSKEEFREWVIEHAEALDVVENLLARTRNASLDLRVDTSGKVTFEDIVSAPPSPGHHQRADSAMRLSFIVS